MIMKIFMIYEKIEKLQIRVEEKFCKINNNSNKDNTLIVISMFVEFSFMQCNFL